MENCMENEFLLWIYNKCRSINNGYKLFLVNYPAKKLYANYFADIAWSNDFSHSDKYCPEHHWCSQNDRKGTSNQNQTRRKIWRLRNQRWVSINSEWNVPHRKNNHYCAMAAHKENHISSEWLKIGTRSQIWLKLMSIKSQLRLINVVTILWSNTIMRKS